MTDLLRKKKTINLIINVLIIVIFIAAVIPFFVTAKYALFVTDDFPTINAVVRNYDGSYFRTGIKCAAHYWHVWNGNWFSFTIAYWLHPLAHGGQKALVLALRIHLVLTVTGVLYFCFALSRIFNLRAEKALRIIALVALPIFLFKEYFDLYLWWLTSCTYLMPLYCFLFGFGTFLFALKCEKTWQYIVSGVFLLAMSGGSLNVVGMGCYLLLFTLVAWSTYKKKICVPGTVLFLTTLIGACVNAFAPGNFVRQNGQENEKVGIVKTFINEIHILGHEGKWLIFNTAFVAFVLLAFLWGIKLNKKITVQNLIVATVASIGLPIVTMFPVVLGYGDITYKDISNRGYGMMDISIIFASCFMGVLWGIYLKGFIKEKVKAVGIVVGIAAFVCMVLWGQNPLDVVPVRIIANLYNDYNANFYNTWMDIFSECENSDEGDVVIKKDVPKRQAGCSWAKLSEDPDMWWNTSIAEYYGLDSLVLVDTLDD